MKQKKIMLHRIHHNTINHMTNPTIMRTITVLLKVSAMEVLSVAMTSMRQCCNQLHKSDCKKSYPLAQQAFIRDKTPTAVKSPRQCFISSTNTSPSILMMHTGSQERNPWFIFSSVFRITLVVNNLFIEILFYFLSCSF